MDDEEIDIPSEQMLSCFNMANAQSSYSFYSGEFLDRTQACDDTFGLTEACADAFGQTQTCTHAHACQPCGPDKSHTHTCIHVHTQIMPTPSAAPTDDAAESIDKAKKRPLGNHEAVCKYREKKKSRAASLENEIIQLRALNEQLMQRLQGEALLQAEIARLKCLLVDIRGRIEGEIGSFPYMRPTNAEVMYQNLGNSNLPSTYMMNPCNMEGKDQHYCLLPGSAHVALNARDLNGREFNNLHCLGNQNSVEAVPECGLNDVNGTSCGTRTSSSKRRGACSTAKAS